MNDDKSLQQQQQDDENERIDEASEESFPASDAPSFTPISRSGPPKHPQTERK